MPAGNYDSRVYWMPAVSSQGDNLAEDELYPESEWVEMWADWEQIPTQEVIEDGIRKWKDKAVFTVRGYPDISTKDRIKSKYWETVYTITGITYGFNETIIQAESFP